MDTPDAIGGGASGPVLFVAREPDETLRTYLPVIDYLRSAHAIDSRVVFHHQPGPWARDELAARSVPTTTIDVPAPGRGQGRLVSSLAEIVRYVCAQRLARKILHATQYRAVVVIQDTLLLERFLVREANSQSIPTLVIQWAFSYPQAMYDRLREVRRNAESGGAETRSERGRRLGGRAYRMILDRLGLGFELANSYGGGEARLFAVMGEAFADQYRAQGVRNKTIAVTGHPTHDQAYERAARLTDQERTSIKVKLGVPADRPLVLYATQPVLWRKVLTRAQLRQNVAALAAAVAATAGSPSLLIKLHPREKPEDYAFCADLDPPVSVIESGQMTELIAGCDVFVSSSSSTVLLAMMLDRPIVTLNFNQVPHFDYFESIGGTLHTRTPSELAAALRLALSDTTTRDVLAEQRRMVLDRYTRFDGKATERIAALLASAVSVAVARPAV